MLRFARFLLVLPFLAILPSTGFAEEIRYSEDFALARDRAEALRQLISGTEEYYYYHCLYYQHTEQFDQVDELLARGSSVGNTPPVFTRLSTGRRCCSTTRSPK